MKRAYCCLDCDRNLKFTDQEFEAGKRCPHCNGYAHWYYPDPWMVVVGTVIKYAIGGVLSLILVLMFYAMLWKFLSVLPHE